MKKLFYLLGLLVATWMTPLSMSAQCPGATRNVTDCKAGTENAIGWAMKNFFQDGSTSTWNWESGAKFVENTDGTADLTGVIAHLGNPTTRRFQVSIRFINQNFTAPSGSPVLFNTTPSIAGWYYYDWGASTLTGLNDLAGAKLTLQKRDKPVQIGKGAADQIEEIGKFTANGWFSWSIVSQPTANWLAINPFPQNPSVDEADICIGLSGEPTNCADPCDSDATSPTFTNCPTNINLTTANTCSVANWVAPTADDNCGIPTVSLTTSPTAGLGIGSCFPVGTTTITYKATDAKGNIAVCFFTVTVVKTNTCDTDTEPPTFTNCPANINLTTTNNCTVANWIAPTTSDNCGTPTVTLTTSPTAGLGIGSCFPVGTTTVTYKATDAKGNSATCTFTVNVTSQGNVLDCNNVNLRSSNSAIIVSGLTAPYVNIQAYKVFDFGGWLSVFECVGNQCSRPAQTITNLEATNHKVFVTFFNDKWEQVCVIDKEIVVTTDGEDPCDTDATPPTFTNCPTNISLTTANSCAVANWTAPTANDNCGTPTVSLTTSPTAGLGIGSCFPVGTTTVTYKATDAKGNSATCSFTVTVTKTDPCDTDATKPTFTNCPTNISLTTANSCAVANWTAPTANDNCGTPSVSLTTLPTAGLGIGSCFPVGTTTVSYKATDAKGNSATCSFTVTVTKTDPCDTDATKPTFANCPTNISLTTANSCAVANWAAPTANDNCGTPTVSLTTSPTAGLGIGSCFPVGTTTVSYKATDAKGNSATCSFTVTVTKTDPCDTDATKPTFANCPTNISLTTANSCAVANWTAPTANDNCGTPSVSLTTSPTADLGIGSCFPVGTTTVSYKATDAKGNSATCSFTVTVTKTDPCDTDATKPTFTNCPTNISLTTANSCAVANWTAPTASDNCGTPTVSLTTSPTAGLGIGSCFPVGTTTVSYKATDAKGNSATCSFTVTVTKTDPCDTDATKPTFANCPTNISLTTANSCAVANWTAPTANDNCGTPTVSLTTSPTAGLGIGSCFPVGTTTVSYKATDAKGNSATCSFTVTVTKTDPCDTDATKPTFTNCPTNISLTTANSCAVANWTAPTASDNCGTPTVSLTTSPTAGLGIGSCFPVGTTTVSYKATDAKGNSATCSFTVTVTKTDPCDTDATKPTFANCPTNISLTTANSCAVANWAAPTANDNCGTPTVSLTTLPTAGLGIGSCFPVGTTTVTYKATDAKGNSTTCSFTVTVTKTDPCDTDATKPTFANCPTNISLTTANSCAVANWTAPTANDNCGTPTVSLTTSPTAGLGIGSCFPVGTTTVSYKATDAKGNSATCSFTVKVVKIVTCNNVTNAGKISKACADGKVTLSNTESPSGGSGTLEYVWLKSTVRCPPGNHDEVVPNSNTPTLVVGSVTQTTYFVRCVRRVGCTTEDDFKESNCIIVSPGDCSNGLNNGDCVKIANKKSGKTIDVFRSLTWSGTKIIQKSYDNTKSQKWTFKNLGNGYYIIISKNSGKVLDIDGTGDYCATGSHLIQDYYDGSKSQQFKLVKNADGSYKIINRRCNKVLKVYNGSSDSGASIVLGEDSDSDHSKWLIDKVDCPSSSHHLTANTVFTLEANAQFNRTHLEWINNSTVQNDYFTIQKINNQSGNFEDVETVNAVEGLDELQYYTAYDNNPTDGENYYRIKLVYQDGKIEYSETKIVNFKGLSDVRIFPNPSDDFVDVDLTKYKNNEVGIYLYNAFGQPVQFVNVEKVGDTPVRLDVSKFNSGNFLLRITSKGKRDVTKQLIITR